MTLARCFDAAYPPPFVPAGASAVLGYLPVPGYDRNYHSWTPQEWLPFKGLRQFPVVELRVDVDPASSARACVAVMRRFGWFPGRALVGALETYVVPKWYAVWEREVEALGQVPVGYGSESTIYQNQPTTVWEALYDGRPVLPGPPTEAKQFMSGGSMDWSVVAPALMEHGGLGPRNQEA
jgi:hypothetical protein